MLRVTATCTVSTLQPFGYVASSFVTGAPPALGSVKNPIALPEWSSPLPVDSDTAASIVYSGAPGSFTKHGQYFSLGDVLAGSVAPSSLKGKVVVVGAMGLPQSPDQVRTPTSSGEMWGPEAQANITAMFLSQSWAP